VTLSSSTVSAKTKEGLDDLLETISSWPSWRSSEPIRTPPAVGHRYRVKARSGPRPVVTILVSRGTLEVGDALVAGAHWARVRAMHDFLGSRIGQAAPGEPVEVLGFDGVPEVGRATSGS